MNFSVTPKDDYEFLKLENYNCQTQLVVFSEHLVNQLFIKKLPYRAKKLLCMFDVLSRMTGFGCFMTQGFVPVVYDMSINQVKEQLTLKNMKEAIRHLKDIKIQVSHFVDVGKERNKRITLNVNLFNKLELINTDHGKGVVFEFNHITTQLIDNRLGKDEYFKIYAIKHSLLDHQYTHFHGLIAETLFKMCSIEYGFTTEEVNHFVSLSPEKLVLEFNSNPIFNEKFSRINQNGVLQAQSQYKKYNKILFASTQCFEKLHTHLLHTYILSKRNNDKHRFIGKDGNEVYIDTVTALELREALDFNLPKYDDNYELSLAIGKLVSDLNKFTEFNVNITRIARAGNRGLKAEYQLTVALKSDAELKLVHENFKFKAKGNIGSEGEFKSIRDFLFKNFYRVNQLNKVELVHNSLFLQVKPSPDQREAPNNIFSAGNNKYSQAHLDGTQKPESTQPKIAEDSIAEKPKPLSSAINVIRDKDSIIVDSEYDIKISKIVIMAFGREMEFDQGFNRSKIPTAKEFHLSRSDVNDFRNSLKFLTSPKERSWNIKIIYDDGNFDTAKLTA